MSAAEALRLLSGGRDYTERQLLKFITADPVCLALKDTVRKLAGLQDTVLITAPSGHGKEIIARALHWKPECPFIAVNCAAMPDTLLPAMLFGHVKGMFTGATEDRPGLFEQAQGGTIFLDAIGDMPETQQPALLRVLQERVVTRLGSGLEVPIHCRIVAATNDTSRIRHDLYGRLMEIELTIPPLSTRPDDIAAIMNHLGAPSVPIDRLASATQLNTYGVRWLHALAKKHKYGIN